MHNRTEVGNPQHTLPKDVHPTGWNASKSFEIFGEGWGCKDLESQVDNYGHEYFGVGEEMGLLRYVHDKDIRIGTM